MKKETEKKLPEKVTQNPDSLTDLPVDQPVKSGHLARNFLITGILALLLLSMAGAIFLFGAKGSLAQVKVGSIIVKSNINQVQLEQQIEETAKAYKITLIYSNGTRKAYLLNETGVSIDAKASAKAAKERVEKNPLQRLAWWRSMDIELKSKTDRAKFHEFINTKATEVKTPSKDSSLIISGGEAVITPAEKGSGYQVPNAELTISDSIKSLNANPLSLKASTLHPSIEANNLKSSKEKANKLLAQKVAFNIAGHNIDVSPADIASWLEITPVKYDKTIDISVDSGKIEKYIDKIAKPYVQPPRSRLISKVTDGYVVLDQGADGVDVVNKNQTATDIAKKLMDGQGLSVDLPTKYAAAKTVEAEAYDKWLVVDVTTKRMYAYEKTSLVKTFLVSAGAPKTPTVTGKFAIYSKLKSQDMRGLNADGSRYFQPGVPYVNYFYKDYAVHGNYWRPSSYFGNVNSSHGCVGSVVSDAAWIYGWAPIGTPVIVHS